MLCPTGASFSEAIGRGATGAERTLLPMSISADAITGFIGVVLGAGITGGVDIVLAKRAEHHDAAAARRLIHSELSAYAAALEHVVESGEWRPILLDELRERPQWTANCDRLARDLPNTTWKRMDWVYWNQQSFVARAQQGGTHPSLMANPFLTHVREALKELESLDPHLSSEATIAD